MYAREVWHISVPTPTAGLGTIISLFLQETPRLSEGKRLVSGHAAAKYLGLGWDRVRLTPQRTLGDPTEAGAVRVVRRRAPVLALVPGAALGASRGGTQSFRLVNRAGRGWPGLPVPAPRRRRMLSPLLASSRQGRAEHWGGVPRAWPESQLCRPRAALWV